MASYPPLPMGMIPPIPYCMPGMFPFMGMFPPFWLPAAAMAATTMPALAANASVATALPGVAGMVAQAAGPMWPAAMLSACTTAAQPLLQATTAPMQAPARASSGVSSAAALPSTSCSNSAPTAGAVQASSSPPLVGSPTAASPVSVCNGGLPEQQQQQPEDDEFANFIDSILHDGSDQDLLLRCGGIDLADQHDGGLAVLHAGDLLSSGGSNCSEGTTDDDRCLTRSDSHSLLSLLGPDIGLTGL
ncbi:hypothetical protein PLESTF_001019000 [Pleodorina starrii]|nr:hypothetical protein PLESTM_001094600 [Pleodorina starrii]GLC70659.1 hypothetical protein PLESTF_001019000 [Pleodorina starrii]